MNDSNDFAVIKILSVERNARHQHQSLTKIRTLREKLGVNIKLARRKLKRALPALRDALRKESCKAIVQGALSSLKKTPSELNTQFKEGVKAIGNDRESGFAFKTSIYFLCISCLTYALMNSSFSVGIAKSIQQRSPIAAREPLSVIYEMVVLESLDGIKISVLYSAMFCLGALLTILVLWFSTALARDIINPASALEDAPPTENHDKQPQSWLSRLAHRHGQIDRGWIMGALPIVGVAVLIGFLSLLNKPAQSNPMLETPEMTSLRIAGMNYTDREISSFKVNETERLGLLPYQEFSQSDTGWEDVPRKWSPNFKITVTWYYKDSPQEKHTATIPMRKYSDESSWYLYVAFLPDQKVEIFLAGEGLKEQNDYPSSIHMSPEAYEYHLKNNNSKMAVPSINGVNYTSREIANFYVDEAWGGSLNAYSEAEEFITADVIQDDWKPYYKMLVTWYYDDSPTEQHTAVVDMPKYPGDGPWHLFVVFLPKGKVEVFTTKHSITDPDYPGTIHITPDVYKTQLEAKKQEASHAR